MVCDGWRATLQHKAWPGKTEQGNARERRRQLDHLGGTTWSARTAPPAWPIQGQAGNFESINENLRKGRTLRKGGKDVQSNLSPPFVGYRAGR